MKKQVDLIHDLIGKEKYRLIILDACRYDYFEKVFSDSRLTGELECIESAGRDTFEFLQNVFPEKYDLTYLSGVVPINSKVNQKSCTPDGLYGGYVPKEHFKSIVDVWESGWSDELGTVPPERVTESALVRETDEMIIQYLQPHAPFIGDYQLLGGTGDQYGKARGNPPDAPIWNDVNRGLIARSEIEKAYGSNLRMVLGEVSSLINRLNCKENIIISSDHGEMLGEDGQWAHKRINHPKLREIPWLEVKA